MKINAERIRALRLQRQWSQEQLATACGLNLRTIQRLETTGNASLESVKALAAVFSVDSDTLVTDTADASDATGEPDAPRMAAVRAVQASIHHFADFTGRAARPEFWWFFLFVLLLAAIATTLHPKAYQIVTILVALPLAAVGTRRLRDAGQSPWWQLMYLVPFGLVVPLYLMTLPSQPVPEINDPRPVKTS